MTVIEIKIEGQPNGMVYMLAQSHKDRKNVPTHEMLAFERIHAVVAEEIEKIVAESRKGIIIDREFDRPDDRQRQ